MQVNPDHSEITIIPELKLVLLDESYTDELYGLTVANREYLQKYLPWVEHVNSPEDSKAFILEQIKLHSAKKTYGFGIVYNDELIGHTSLMNFADGEKQPEIGYWIAEKFSGRGITTMTTRALTELGHKHLKLQKIILRADVDNVASNKVAKKAGFSPESQVDLDSGSAGNLWVSRI